MAPLFAGWESSYLEHIDDVQSMHKGRCLRDSNGIWHEVKRGFLRGLRTQMFSRQNRQNLIANHGRSLRRLPPSGLTQGLSINEVYGMSVARLQVCVQGAEELLRGRTCGSLCVMIRRSIC